MFPLKGISMNRYGHTITPGPSQTECSRINPKYRSHKSYQTQCVMLWPQGGLKTQDVTKARVIG